MGSLGFRACVVETCIHMYIYIYVDVCIYTYIHGVSHNWEKLVVPTKRIVVFGVSILGWETNMRMKRGS